MTTSVPRVVPSVVASLEPFLRAGVLGVTEVQVTATLAQVLPAVRSTPDVLLAIALAVRAPLHGHVRVNLRDVAATIVPAEPPHGESATSDTDPDGQDDEVHLDPPAIVELSGPADGDGPDPAELPWPEPEGWAARLLGTPLARREDDDRRSPVPPLVVRGDDVYLDRYWQDEVAVAAGLRVRGEGRLEPSPAGVAAVARYLPEASASPAQRRAVEAALTRRLLVIAGGPGTGKTYTIARLLAVLAEDGGDTPPEVALAAPTGKAAARLSEAIDEAFADAAGTGLQVPRSTAVGGEARTLHRLLGYRSGGASFRHDRSNPLTADVVVVDEVSMVSLTLMARLLDAVRPDARIVLVGDPYQLASVEAGAVLGDVVGVGDGVPPAGVEDNVVTLDRVFRFDEGSAVGHLAAAVKEGDPSAVVDLLRHGPTGTDGAVRWIDPSDEPAVATVREHVTAAAAEIVTAARSGAVVEAIDRLGLLKVLCATRRGPLGVRDWNQAVERGLRRDGMMRRRWSAGRPVMVTANDYLNGVFNGDVGVVVRSGDDRGGRNRRVAFDAAGGPRLLDPSRLADVETQWAMTIHKSQGSEFDHVVITLPPPPSPILTRELLYTAVTRARRAVTIVASESAVRAAVERPVLRSSGLAERLA